MLEYKPTKRVIFVRTVQYYKGNEIDDEKIVLIKSIAKSRYSDEIYEDYFEDVENVFDLAYLHSESIESESLVLGDDWFLCYSEHDCWFYILEWVALETGNLIQTYEMMETLMNLLYSNSEKVMIADMRHDTSYSMYSKLLRNGYFREISHDYIVDCAMPRDVYKLDSSVYLDDYDSIPKFLELEEEKGNSEYLRYILHDLEFRVTSKFVDEYEQKTKRKRL